MIIYESFQVHSVNRTEFFLLGTLAYTNNWLSENISRPMYLTGGVVMQRIAFAQKRVGF